MNILILLRREKVKNKFVLFLGIVLILGFIQAGYTWNDTAREVNYSAFEDTTYYHNMTLNLSGGGTGENRTYSIDVGGGLDILWNDDIINYSTISSWIFIDSIINDFLVINATQDNHTGIFRLPLKIAWDTTGAYTDSFYFNVTPINDAPVFANLSNQSMSMGDLFTYNITATDEEDNFPLDLNISFVSCETAQWSTRNSTNCTLFDSDDYTFDNDTGQLNISFTPSKNDVGNYTINFTIADSGNTTEPFNASREYLINFQVLNSNSFPVITYVCDNERNWTEGNNVLCYINATDEDEVNNLTFDSNYSWFLDDEVSDVNLSTNFSGFAVVNFTPTDVNVGNWSILINVSDTGEIQRVNSTEIYFFIDNVEDNPSLDSVSNKTVYTNTTFYVNATDDDLLVSDDSVKDEVLTFGSNTSWVDISTHSISNSNYVTAKVEIDYDYALSNLGEGNYSVKINVTDDFGNSDEQIFNVEILANNPVVWDPQTETNYNYNESTNVYLNLSLNVSDADNDTITFTYSLNNTFTNFDLSSAGIINFTPTDADVGSHLVSVNATDGKENSPKDFVFTISNVNDAPSIGVFTSNTPNATYNSTSVSTAEDNLTIITLFVYDDDFKIPSAQRVFYNESLTLFTNVSGGPNSSLINFTLDSLPSVGENRSIYTATFTPAKTDVGNYSVLLNLTDFSNSLDNISFDVFVYETDHNPTLSTIDNQTSTVNRSFYYQFVAYDEEDGYSNETNNTNFTFSYNFINGTSFLNSTNFNFTTGEIDITFNDSQYGTYLIEITVNDSNGMEDAQNFSFFVYEIPSITFPLVNNSFYLKENVTSSLNFSANHSVGDNLTYQFYVPYSNGTEALRYNVSYFGNNTNLTWNFTPGFTDETYNQTVNLTLLVINSIYPDINYSTYWNLSINHTNAPIEFSGSIPAQASTYSNSIDIDLSDYFSDVDATDSYYGQSVNFTLASNANSSGITYSVANWVMTLSASSALSETVNITGFDLENGTRITNATSNNFLVTFTTPTTIPAPSSGGGGGGGSKKPSTTPVLEISIDEVIYATTYDYFSVPFELKNAGSASARDIYLNATLEDYVDGNISFSFPTPYIDVLDVGESMNLSFLVYTNLNETGKFKATIFANGTKPKVSDWANFYISVIEKKVKDVQEFLLFVERFVVENPECIELYELVQSAQGYFDNAEIDMAYGKAEEALKACEESISRNRRFDYNQFLGDNRLFYAAILTALIFLVGIGFYFYKKVKLNKLNRLE